MLPTTTFHVLAIALLLGAGATSDSGKPDFENDVQPIFAKRCYSCHTDKVKGGLRLDRRADALRGGDSGRVIVPGRGAESKLIQLVAGTNPDEVMPPKGDRLADAEVAVLRAWIDQGASWPDRSSGDAPKHWAYIAPARVEPPSVKSSAWVRNPIDSFVLARLEREGLEPSPEAERAVLLRRASLDLTGLPPALDEVEAFLSDASPNAYESAVERLLQSPAYGERWARLWLDLARYADTQGYEKDNRRTIWRYRDWVIDAFNRNLPFDEFTIEQIAGDMLPNATLDQRIATAFHRNTMTNTEGGTDNEEFRNAAVVDRVNTTFAVWMGTTLNCCQCHSHKYDPFTQKEYYGVFAFLNGTQDADNDDESPYIEAPTPEEEARAAELRAEIAAARAELERETPELAAARDAWERSVTARSGWTVLEPTSMRSAAGAELKRLDDGSILASGAVAPNDTYTISADTTLEGITAFRLEVIPDPGLPRNGPGRAEDGNFVLSKLHVAEKASEPSRLAGRFVRVDLPGDSRPLSLAEVQVLSGGENGENLARAGSARQSSTEYGADASRAIDGDANGDWGAGTTTHTLTENDPWWELDLGSEKPIDSIAIWNRTDGGLHVRLAAFRVTVLSDARRLVWARDVDGPPNPSVQLAVAGPAEIALHAPRADFSQDGFPVANALAQKNVKKSGWAVAPHMGSPHAAVFTTRNPAGMKGGATLTFTLEHQYERPTFLLGRFRLSATTDPNAAERAAVPAEILAIADTPAEKRDDSQRLRIAAHFRSIAPGLQPLRDRIAKLQAAMPKPSTVPVMVELASRRATNVQIRGSFLSKGDPVTPGVPAVLHPLPEGAPLDRLTFARWLVDARNPLTARVLVNRVWEQYFGSGIVKTLEDFGTQGERPVHPELLDWLATELLRDGWDVKALHRLIVTSAAYRQSSRVTPKLLELDPENRLLARGPRVRLAAETIRDQALAVSGLLSKKMLGPSVMPPQPEGIWQVVYSGDQWITSPGDDKYRRGLYTFWRRTMPYPAMVTFDAPSREFCSVKRPRTNTPLQALTTLNDAAFVEAAQALARRIVIESPPGASVEQRAARGFRLCLSRRPSDAETSRLVRLFESELERYKTDSQAATAMASKGLGPPPGACDVSELAAWTVVSNVLLNLDELIMKG